MIITKCFFLQGGASTQFFHVPYNFLRENQTAAYLDTGSWSAKAIKEARLFGNVNVVSSSKDQGLYFLYLRIIKCLLIVHTFTSLPIIPFMAHRCISIRKQMFPVIVDMSSDIFSRSMDYNQFAMIYAGAQKNLGTCRYYPCHY